MKKNLLVITLVLAGFCSNSQDLKNVKLFTELRQFDKAKAEVDGYLGIEKNASKAEGWYFKAYIYNSLGRAEGKAITESKSLYAFAYDAIKKYTALDPKVPLTTEEKNSTLFNIYYGFYDLGIKTYNSKDFTESYDCFKKTLDVHDYIFDNKLIGPNDLKFAAHDTDIVWNLAILANELKKKDEAAVFYKRIADADLSEERYVTAYDDLVLKYKREKNGELFAKYLAAAKKYYPVDKAYWETQEIDFAIKDLEGEALLNKYEELTKTLPDNYMVFYNYALEIDKFLTGAATAGKDVNAYKLRIEELFKKAISIKSTIEANLQLANIYYSKTYDLQDRIARIKGTKPEEVKVKNELKAKLKTTMNDCVPYAQEAVKLLETLTEYKFGDKANFKLALEILAHASKMNGDAVKAAEYDKKKEGIDKL